MILPGASKCFFCAMKKIFTVMVAAFVSLAAFAQGHATYKEKEHDFGYIKEAKGAVSHTFELKNTGDKPLVIMQVVTSCGCTRPEFPTKPIKPGKKGKIKVTFSPIGRPGPFRKEIRVKTNGRNKMVRLHIEGSVIGKDSQK